MAVTCAVDFSPSISYLTSYTLLGLSPTVWPLLMADGQQYANARSTRHSMFAMKPEVEIWPRVGVLDLLGTGPTCLWFLKKSYGYLQKRPRYAGSNLVLRPKTV